MHRFTVVAVSSFWLLASSSQRVVELDSSGHFPGRTTATVVLSKPFDLDSRKDLIVVPPNDFLKGEVANIHYFNEIITPEELQKSIVRNGLAANRDLYTQFVLTDPLTLDDLFVVETHLDFIWTGVNDQNNWYPMFNALIDYIKSNSKTYGK
jgi:hypothetical protein